jgi:LPS export ABC transporter protein LptC
VLAGLLAAALACGRDEVAPRRPLTTQAGAPERAPDQIIENGTHVVTREGVKRAVLQARQIEFYNAEAKVEADTMEMTFFDARGVEESRLTARYGEIDQRTEDVLARGDVMVVASDGTRISGEELRYDSAADRITSDQPVTIVREGNRIQGDGVEADPALTSIRVTGSSAVLERTPRPSRRRGDAGTAPGPAAAAAPPGGAAVPVPAAPPSPAPAGEAPPADAPAPGEAAQPGAAEGATPQPAAAEGATPQPAAEGEAPPSGTPGPGEAAPAAPPALPPAAPAPSAPSDSAPGAQP